MKEKRVARIHSSRRFILNIISFVDGGTRKPQGPSPQLLTGLGLSRVISSAHIIILLPIMHFAICILNFDRQKKRTIINMQKPIDKTQVFLQRPSIIHITISIFALPNIGFKTHFARKKKLSNFAEKLIVYATVNGVVLVYCTRRFIVLDNNANFPTVHTAMRN